jgi:hypothetical protein
VKHWNDHAGVRVNGGQVRALAEIAALATPRQVLEFIRATMLLRNNVLEVERPKRKVFLVELAILAARSGPLTYVTS